MSMFNIRIDRDDVPYLVIDWQHDEYFWQIVPHCPFCDGVGEWYGGWYEPTEYCGFCNGRGWITLRQWLWVQVHKPLLWRPIDNLLIEWHCWVNRPTDRFKDDLCYFQNSTKCNCGTWVNLSTGPTCPQCGGRVSND